MLVFLLVFVGGWFSNWQHQKEPDPDQIALNHLKKAGSDLSKPHTIEFFLYFSTERLARQAADELKKMGCKVKVELDKDDAIWGCAAIKEMIPKRAELVRLRKYFKVIAKKFKGEYDGWETGVVK